MNPMPTAHLRMRLLTSCTMLAAVMFVTTASVSAQQSSAASKSTGGPSRLYSGLLGDWVGQLEYRDFSSDQRVLLPTWLSVTADRDGKSLQFAYTYDDGPSKTVKELSTVTLDESSETATFTSDRDHSSDTYKVEGMPEFTKTGWGKLLLTGKGVENDKPVDVRIVIVVRRNLYTYQKETRLPGQEFLFRDGYTFTRKESLP